MRFAHRFSPRRSWPFLLLGGIAAAGLISGALRLQAVVRDQVPGLLKSSLETALGRQVEFGVLHVWAGGLTIENFRLPRVQGEPADPLTARRLRASLDWWRLLRSHEVRVSRVDLDVPHVRLSPAMTKPGSKPWSSQLLGLSKSGVRTFGVHSGTVQLIDLASRHTVWYGSGVDGSLDLRSSDFRYRARLAGFKTAQMALGRIRLAGTGDDAGVQLDEGSAIYQGGNVSAVGDVKAANNHAALSLRVEKLSLSRLAGQIGIPAEWAMQGRVTGEITVDARDNGLRNLRGTVQVDRGSLTRGAASLPWQTASGRIDWSPERTILSGVKVNGRGVTLTADGDIRTEPGKPFTEGQFQATGRLSASRKEAVVQVAELLAFRRALDGRWDAQKADLAFQAHGAVRDLAAATASGHLIVDGLQFQPTPERDRVHIARIEADVTRDGAELSLRHLTATSDGLGLAGDITLTDERPGKPAQLTASGTADVASLKALRQALPDAALWKWVPVASPEASGRLEFRLSGPTSDPSKLLADGRFEAKDFRLSARSPLPNGAIFFIPMDSATGEFHHEGRSLKISGLLLKAHSFAASGTVALNLEKAEPTVDTALHLTTNDWKDLPAVPSGVVPELTGGRFEADFHLAGDYGQLTNVPVDGTFSLTGATYRPSNPKSAPIPVEELKSSFHWADRTLDLPDVSLKSPLLQATAKGRSYPAPDDYHLALDIDASSPSAGDLIDRFVRDLNLAGGAASAQFHLDAPVQQFEKATAKGTLRMQDARIARRVELLGRDSLELRELKTAFSWEGDRWSLNDLALDSGGLKLAFTGSGSMEQLDAQVKFSTDTWSAPESVPVSGGKLALEGHIYGSTEKPEALAFDGVASLDGATLRYHGKELALAGGKLKLDAHGEGSIEDPGKWARRGSFTVADAQATLPGRQPDQIDSASARFVHEGDHLSLRDAKLDIDGVAASGTGEWTPDRHELKLTADATTLARLGIKLPEGLKARRYGIALALSGTAKQPVQEAGGRMELEGVEAALAGMPAQTFDRVTGGFRYADDTLHLDHLQGSGPAGILTVDGDWSRQAQHLTVTASGSDFKRLGFDLAVGFGIHGFQVRAELSGTAKKPLSTGSGTLQVTGVQFPFGPLGPHALHVASGKFSLEGKRLTITDLTTSGPTGQASGTASFSSEGWKLSLDVARMNPDVVRWLLPGKVTGGALSGTLELAGPTRVKEGEDAVRLAAGHFELAGARYTVPPDLKLLGGEQPVSRFAGDYHWEPGGTTLKNVVLDSELLRADGALTVSDKGKGKIQAQLTTANAGRVADFWPVLAGKLMGGTATGKLDARFDEKGLDGSLALEDRGGTLMLLPDVPDEYRVHPVDQMSMTLGFEPNRLRFSSVKVRGPRGNADGEGQWTADGPVFGKGKVWFTKQYTSRLIKPSGMGWLAKLFGVKEIKTDFELSGQSDRVMLKSGITRSFLWKFAKGAVPKEFRDVAAGKTPLWVAPLEVAETPGGTPKP